MVTNPSSRRSFGAQGRGSDRRRPISRIHRLRKSSHPYQNTNDPLHPRDSLTSSLSSFSSSASESEDPRDWASRPSDAYKENERLVYRQSVLSASLSQPVRVLAGGIQVPARCLLVHLIQAKASLGPFRVIQSYRQSSMDRIQTLCV